jgi:hypothetical protein
MPVVVTSKSRNRSKKLEKDAALIEKSLKRYKLTAESESKSRKQGLEDLKFSIGTGQWDESVAANRELEGKPCLVVNRAPSFLRQFTGEERQHRPALIVDPVGSGADEEIAAINQGVLRHIEVASFADTVYDQSYDMMLRIGWDYWRIQNQYITDVPGDDDSAFQQEPRIVGIENAFAVYMSPIRKPDGSDPLWCHVVENFSKEAYEEEFGKTEIIKLGLPTDMGNAEPTWVVKDGVRVAEYWWLELTRKELLLLDDGRTTYSDKFKGDKGMIAGRRDCVAREVCWVKHNGLEVLKRKTYKGMYIPIVELSGVRLNVNGGVYRAGIVRDYRDAQRIYDFMVTRAVEQVDLTGKDPLFVAEGSIAGHEEEYRQMNRKNYPYMYFKAYDQDGKQLPPPTRANREPPIQAMHMLIQQADYDMKSVIGIYGSGPGEQPNPNESAFGILSREQAQGTGTINWSDNLNRAVRWGGKIILDLYPRYIDAPRINRIINPDDSVKTAILYNSQNDGDDPGSQKEQAMTMINPKILKKVYDVGKGDYDVTLSAGPQYRTARKEAFKAIGALIESEPSLFPVFGDVWLKYGDFPGGNVLSDRAKKMLPPNLQDNDPTDPATQLQALQAQIAQFTQEKQQMVAELARATDTIRTKRLELESRERIANFNAQAGMIEALLKSNAAAGVQAMQAELDIIKDRMLQLHANIGIEQDAGAAPATPEMPGEVEPKTMPITPAAPATPVQGTSGGPQ